MPLFVPPQDVLGLPDEEGRSGGKLRGGRLSRDSSPSGLFEASLLRWSQLCTKFKVEPTDCSSSSV